MKRNVCAFTMLVLICTSCKEKEPTLDMSSEEAIKESLELVTKELSKKEKGQLLMCCMKVAMLQEENKILKREESAPSIHGKTFKESMAICKQILDDEVKEANK